MTSNRFGWGLFIALVSVGVTIVVTLTASVSYFQGKVDTLERSLGEYAIRESRAAANRAVDAVEKAEADTLKAVEAIQEIAEQAITRAQADAVSVIADARGIAANAQAVVKLNEYFKRRWCNRAEVRQLGTTYRNTTALPLEIAVTMGIEPGKPRPPICRVAIVVDKTIVVDDRGVGSRMGRRLDGAPFCTTTVTIPAATAYAVEGSGRVIAWYELSASPCK